MRIKGFLLILAGALAARAQEFDEADASADLALAVRLAALLPPSDDARVPELLERLAASDVETDRDLGYGARRLRLDFYGEYGTVWLDLLVASERVVALRVCHRIDSDRIRDLEPHLRSAWKAEGIERRKNALYWEWTHPERRRALDEARAEVLGEPEEADLDGKQKASVDVLCDPLREHYYGTVFGWGGDPPEGRVALERLVKGGLRAALRNVARGPSPEGRLYAAEGLLRLGGLSEVEKRLVEAARNQTMPIVCADGCLVVERPAAEALDGILEDR